MHLHPGVLPLHILFVPLNCCQTITDPYNSPDTQWLSPGSLFFFFTHPILPPLTLLFQFSPPPLAILPSGIPGVLSVTVVFTTPLWCWHGWCILVCNDVFFQIDSNWAIMHGNNEKTPTTVNWGRDVWTELLVLGNTLPLDLIPSPLITLHYPIMHTNFILKLINNSDDLNYSEA